MSPGKGNELKSNLSFPAVSFQQTSNPDNKPKGISFNLVPYFESMTAREHFLNACLTGRRGFVSFLLAGIMALLSQTGFAQFYNGTQMTFGKNRIQYEKFLWTYYKFDDFDTYFYLNGKELAEAAARYATLQIPEMERRLEMNLGDKMQFIIFNNLSDLKQSNIGLSGYQRYNTGGITHIIGGKVFLYFDGNMRNFERQIRAGIAEVLLNQIFYGSSIGSQIKNTTLFTLPEWYKNGLLSYLSEEWNTEIDNRVRDGILSGRYNKFNHLEGEDALYAGHAMWKYVADKYGSSAITDIVAMTQISRSVENGFMYVVGVSFKDLNLNCIDYFWTMYESEETGRATPVAQDLKRVRKDRVYSRYKYSPDGNMMLYVDYDDGKYRVHLKNLLTGKKRVILSGGFRLAEKVDYSYPLAAWNPNGKIVALMVERKGEIYLYFYNIEEKSYQRIILYEFEKVTDFSYSSDGRSFAMSAVRKGQADLYLYNIAAGSHQQLTNDVWDDLAPVFFEGGRKILFSSNRPSDTLAWDPDDKPMEVPRSTDLFIFQRDNPRTPLLRITQTPYANEIQPRAISKNSFIYLSDDNGIYNRYIGTYDSTISYIDTAVHYRYYTSTFPVTNYSRNILEQDVSTGGLTVAQVIYKNGTYLFQHEEIIPVPELSPVTLNVTTQRTQMELKRREEDKKKEISALQAEVGTFKKRFKNVYHTKTEARPPEPKQEEIDIDNYVFDRQAFLTLHPQDTLSKTPQAVAPESGKDEFKIPKRLNYRTEYSINEMATQLDFTSLNFFYQPFGGGSDAGFNNLGLNGFFQVGMTDLLENHRIIAGFRIPLNLNNIEYLFSYANLQRRLDKEFLFVRQATENQYSYLFYTFIERFRSYQFYYMLTYPFSPVLAVKGTASVRYQRFTWLSTNDFALQWPDVTEYWGGLKGEVIYDDTRDLGLNLYSGTRFKLFGEYTQVLGEDDKSMFVVGLDLRNYTRIHRSFIWANRLAASTSFGKNRLIYYMGGVDNWLAPRFEYATPVDNSMNYAYQALATNMRGFYQNARNGNSFVVLNSELRLPVFKYFFNRPIRSDFITNFQLVTFGDLGLAWAGPDPYSEENSFYIRIIEDGSLRIKVREQKEPLIGGFGFGARTRLLGYFLRADVAWGVEDRLVKEPVFYLSLSLDF